MQWKKNEKELVGVNMMSQLEEKSKNKKGDIPENQKVVYVAPGMV